eukprot:TRINITY_DN2357_c3_g3_i2.p1 TRINITY_DN2357_c3_g3~~TRINITY_DN2357_c3_g3_i2.p1  ORF type:complete len:264 (+),score=38.37 TRINITY_DN2357_c3_g3_i2:86-877(+)
MASFRRPSMLTICLLLSASAVGCFAEDLDSFGADFPSSAAVQGACMLQVGQSSQAGIDQPVDSAALWAGKLIESQPVDSEALVGQAGRDRPADSSESSLERLVAKVLGIVHYHPVEAEPQPASALVKAISEEKQDQDEKLSRGWHWQLVPPDDSIAEEQKRSTSVVQEASSIQEHRSAFNATAGDKSRTSVLEETGAFTCRQNTIHPCQFSTWLREGFKGEVRPLATLLTMVILSMVSLVCLFQTFAPMRTYQIKQSLNRRGI